MFLIISSLPKFMQICLVNLGKSFKKENPWYFRIMRKKYFCKVYSESEKFFIRIIGKGNARVYILSRWLKIAKDCLKLGDFCVLQF